jgi:hypothetical protein
MAAGKEPTVVFKDFLEYWYYARYFSDRQKEIIFSSLSYKEQESLIKSCNKGKWDDVLNRNILDSSVDEIREEYGFDLIDIRYRVMKNKSVYVPTSFWEYVLERFEDYKDEQVNFILGGIEALVCKENEEVTLLVPFFMEVKE